MDINIDDSGELSVYVANSPTVELYYSNTNIFQKHHHSKLSKFIDVVHLLQIRVRRVVSEIIFS